MAEPNRSTLMLFFPASLLGHMAEWRRVEMDLEEQMEKYSAWPVCECRKDTKRVFFSIPCIIIAI